MFNMLPIELINIIIEHIDLIEKTRLMRVTKYLHNFVKITDLYNKAHPFIRYDIGDIGKINKLENGSLILEKLIGRKEDYVKLHLMPYYLHNF